MVTLWSWCYFFWQISSNAERALFWCRMLMAPAIFIPVAYLHHISLLLNKVKEWKKNVVVGYLLGVVGLLADCTPYFVKDVSPKLTFLYWPDAGFLYHIFLFFWFVYVFAGVRLITNAYKDSAGFKKNQIKYVLLATALGWGGGATNYPLWYNIPIPPVGNILVSLYVLIVAYTIAQYRLLDIEKASMRAALFLLVYICVLGVPFGVVQLLRNMFHIPISGYWWIPTVVMMVFASGGPFIYLWLQHRAERKKIEARNERLKKLKKISANMVFMTQKKSLMRAMVHQVVKIMQLTHAAVYVRIPQEEEQELEGVQKQGQKKKGEIKRVYQLGDHWGPGFSKISLLESLTEGASVLVDCLSREEFRKSEQALEQDGIRHWAEVWGLSAEEVGALEVVMLGMSASVVIPAYEASGRLFGFLVLGAKRDGSVLEPEELSELMILANHGASAIQAAEGLAEQKRQQAELFHAAALANLGTMAGNIGHQINNRLQSLSAMAGNLSWRVKNILLKDGSDPAKKEEVLKDLGRLLPKMEEETVRAGNIAKSIRRLAKPEGYKETEFEKVVEFVQEMAVYKIKVEEIDLEVVMAKPLEKIWGDIALLAEVFLNLIDNGNDAIEERKERIQRKELPWNQPTPYRGKILLRSRKEGEWVITEVVDSGIGIKPEDMKKLFTPFWTTKGSSGKGTGLGVHVLHQIVLAHKGKIEVESQYGEGTKFTIRLPVYQGQAQTNEEPNEKEGR